MVEWSDVQHMESYKAFERFKQKPSVDTWNEWNQAAHDDIAMKGYAFTGYVRPDGREVSLETMAASLQR